MVIFLVLLGGLLALVAVRRRRKSTLAGLNSDRPTFHVEPPARRVSVRKHEAL